MVQPVFTSQSQANLATVAVPGTWVPTSTALEPHQPYFGWNRGPRLEREIFQLPLESCQRGSLCRWCWQGIPDGDCSGEKTEFITIGSGRNLPKSLGMTGTGTGNDWV